MEEKFKEIFEKSPIGILFVDKEGNLTDANQSALRIGGVPSLNDVIGINIFNAVSMDSDRDKLLEKEHIELQFPVDFDDVKQRGIYNSKRSGTVFIDLTISVIDSGFLVQIQDITEQKRDEGALKESNKRFQDIVETTYDVIYETDASGNLIYLSPQAEKLWGVKVEDVLGTNFFVGMESQLDAHGRSQQESLENLKALLDSPKAIKGLELCFQNFEGKTIVTEVNSTPFFGTSGELLGWRGVSRDITERKKAEEELKESEEKFKSLFSSLIEGVAIHEVLYDSSCNVIDYIINDVNPAYESITGLKRSEIIGIKASEIYGTEEPPYIDIYSQVAETGKHAYFETYFEPMDKHFRIAVTSTDKGKFATLFEDITEIKKAEEEINRRSKLLDGINKIFEESLTCETVEDIVGKCLDVAEDLTGSEFSFIGEVNANGRLDDRALSPPGWEACTANPEKSLELLSNMEIVSYWGRTIKEGKSQIVNDPESDPDRRGVPEGHPKIKSFLGIPLKQGDKTIGMIALANKKEGYTEEDKDNIESLGVAFVEAWMRKKAEIQVAETLEHLEEKVEERTVELEEMNVVLKENELKLKDAIDELKRSNKELQSFAYITSHDLQEPLRTIASFTQLLERRYRGKFDSDADEFMDYIVDAAVRMKAQIQGLLEYSRIDRTGEEFVETDMNIMVENAKTNLLSIIEESEAEITHDDLPVIHTGPNQMERVFQNLIGNSIKFKKPQFPPRIHISAKKQDKEWIFCVEDNGIGMDPQYSGKIFEVFKQLHTRDEYDGTGIGLSIVKKIIESNGGRIWVKSELGAGSTFYFTIPVEPVKTGGGAFLKSIKF